MDDLAPTDEHAVQLFSELGDALAAPNAEWIDRQTCIEADGM